MSTRHLTDDELTAAVASLELRLSTREHLQHCLACHGEVVRLQQLLDQRRQELIALAPSWEEQHEQIRDRLSPHQQTRRGGRWVRPMLALAAGVLISLGVSVSYWSSTQTPAEPAQDEQLETILAEVEEMLTNDDIPGFEPLEEIVPSTDELEDCLGTPAS